MSWDAGDGHHEGWVAHYFEDWNVSSGWANGGPFGSEHYPALPYNARGGDLFWSEAESLGAVCVCSCGWRGSRRPLQDPEADRTREDCHREWKHHLAFWNAEDL